MRSEDQELLLSRLCETEAGLDDWKVFADAAATNPALWSELAACRADAAALREAVELVAAMAQSIDLPDSDSIGWSAAATQSAGPRDGRSRVWIPAHGRRFRRTRILRSWSGWAIAALLALAWIVAWPLTISGTAPLASDGVEAPLHPDQALQAYLDQGRQAGLVLGEIPDRILIDARPAADGQGYDVLYLRQLLERTSVPDLFHVAGEDERGEPTLVRFTHPARRPM